MYGIKLLLNYTLVHEIGHNMGCLHNVEDTSNVGSNYVFSGFSYGKRWTSGGQGYRTVMSYDSEPSNYSIKIPYFSNPDVSYIGTTTGELNADNARVLRSTGPYVSNFRNSIVQGIVASNYDLSFLKEIFLVISEYAWLPNRQIPPSGTNFDQWG